MLENFLEQSYNSDNYKKEREINQLLKKAEDNLEQLNEQEIKSLREYGYSFLGKNNIHSRENLFKAKEIFEAIFDFDGLKKLKDSFYDKNIEDIDVLDTLTFLEDHEAIKEWLNNIESHIDRTNLDGDNELGRFFEDIHSNYLINYIKEFLEENNTPIATGIINRGIDLVAIKNLSENYNISVPIARGGLNQGAIANLWGMKIKIIDIAAHNRKNPKGKWISEVNKEDFEGKKVLLFDKDAITGASIKKTLKMLEKFDPESIAVYFAHNVITKNTIGIGTIIDELPKNIEIFCPNNSPLNNAGDIYIETHKKLLTPYGNRLLLEESYLKDIIPRFQEQYPEITDALKTFISKNLEVYDSLNPYLPGINQVRERMLKRLEQIYKDFNGYLNIGLIKSQEQIENLKSILNTYKILPDDFAGDLIDARYKESSEKEFKVRKIKNPHIPSNPLLAFDCAEKAIKDNFDFALIVGPEGFSYKAYFNDLGLKSISINIPEDRVGVERIIESSDNLEILKNKNILIVEDDVKTGATLEKINEVLKKYSPKNVGLYLGQPKNYQNINNIPLNFKNVYIAGENTTSEEANKNFCKYIKSKNLKIFKTD